MILLEIKPNEFVIKVLFLVSVVFVRKAIGQTEANETGILSDLWSSLTSVGKAPTCPGECVHAITSIFCDNVLEEVTCGANFLRCCVPHEFSFGTPVETSAPIDTSNGQSGEQTHNGSQSTSATSQTTTTSTTTTTTTTVTAKPIETSSVHSSITSHPIMIRPHNPKPFTPAVVFGSLNINKVNPSTPSPTQSTTTRSTTQKPLPIISEVLESSNSEPIPSSVSPLAESCPGVCIKLQYVRYCGNILSNGKCPAQDDQCCLQSEVDFDNSSNIVTVVQQSDSFNASKELSSEKPKVDDMPQIDHKDDRPTTPTPLCEGTCVAPLFSLLCDETNAELYCPNGGTCCVNREATTEAPRLRPCPGNCIPTILSGMCNRPSELILKTLDCNAGSICCHNPHETNEEPMKDINTEESSNEPAKDDAPPVPHHAPHPVHPVPPMPPTNTQSISQILFGQDSPMAPLFPSGPPLQRPQPSNPLPPILLPQPLPHPSNVPILPRPLPLPSTPAPKPPMRLPPIPSQPEPEVDVHDILDNPPNNSLVTKAPGGPPFCPGPCIAPMFRFTCFGGNAIYPKFKCAKSGQLCCAPMTDIQAFEANVLANNGIWKASNQTNYDDSPIKPPPPRRPNPYMCGIKGTQRRETPRVVGGSDSFPGEWCWQIALINAQNQYLCGGALIGAQWVLTAAHCITNLVRSGETIYVRVGDYDLTSQVGSRGAQTQKVSTTYIHHNHNGQTLDNDIALLKLQSPVELNESVCLVCLPARGSKRKPGKRCTVTGYGYKDESGPIALRIREADVPVVDDQECTVKINSVTEKLFILPASSFCAGGDEGNDACQGDGGSGLTCEVDGYYELTGLVSWGFGCGRSGVPGVYVKVSAFVGWINQIISVNNQ